MQAWKEPQPLVLLAPEQSSSWLSGLPPTIGHISSERKHVWFPVAWLLQRCCLVLQTCCRDNEGFELREIMHRYMRTKIRAFLHTSCRNQALRGGFSEATAAATCGTHCPAVASGDIYTKPWVLQIKSVLLCVSRSHTLSVKTDVCVGR